MKRVAVLESTVNTELKEMRDQMAHMQDSLTWLLLFWIIVSLSIMSMVYEVIRFAIRYCGQRVMKWFDSKGGSPTKTPVTKRVMRTAPRTLQHGWMTTNESMTPT